MNDEAARFAARARYFPAARRLIEIRDHKIGKPLVGYAPGGQLRDSATGILWLHSDRDDWNAGGSGHLLPDLTDPATVGFVLSLVRKAYSDPEIVAVRERGAGWIIADGLCSSLLYRSRYIRAETEVDALVAALENAYGGAA